MAARGEMTDSADCRKCRKYQDCSSPCIWVELEINGKVPRREPLASPQRLQYLPQGDYNAALHEGMRSIEQSDLESLESIRNINGNLPTLLRVKAIRAMILGGLSHRQIATVMHLDRSRISHIVKITVVQAK